MNPYNERKHIDFPPTTDTSENVPQELEERARELWDTWNMTIVRYDDGTEQVEAKYVLPQSEVPDGYDATHEVLVAGWDEPRTIDIEYIDPQEECRTERD